MLLQLPKPSNEALAASSSLHALIANEIHNNAGWISFAHFMELALYSPRLGYYSGAAVKLGKDGDFTTAPEITPLFGKTIAHVVADLMDKTAPQIMEFGAGTGKLAHDILTELQAMGITVQGYSIIELSGELRARQQQTLNKFAEVNWLETLPEAFSGIVLGNEVLDAMPVHLVVKTAQAWQERGVGLAADQLVYRNRPCAPELIQHIPHADTLPEGYVTEVHPVALGFMKSLSAMLCMGYENTGLGGAAILIDYGFPANEYYLPQRMQGTLMCHYRHHAHADPFYLPGLQDISSHVDFTALARTAINNGLDVLGYTSQAAFLIDAGIGDRLLRTAPTDKIRYLPQANAVQQLTSPAEMGELFKVLVVGKAVQLPSKFLHHDRSHCL